MKIIKRENYEKTLSATGIHTISGYISKKIDPTDITDVSLYINSLNYQPMRDRTYICINPNRVKGAADELITSYSGFQEQLNFILWGLGLNIEDFDISRADLAFNSTDDNFAEYAKLHKMLILCIVKSYNFHNRYISFDLGKPNRGLSQSARKDDFAIENYNKSIQSRGKDRAANRLELRSKKMSGTTLEQQFLVNWFERLDRARNSFDDMQVDLNNYFEQLYCENEFKSEDMKFGYNLTSFMYLIKDWLFTRKQTIDLLRRFPEVKNPAKRADKFKEYRKIEYFSKKDLDFVIDTLKNKTAEYFNS